MQDTLTAAVLLIGNELLSGSVQDLNLAHIAIRLEERGIRVRETRIVPDIENEIVFALDQLREKYDYVFTTGGIGPTHDDITSDSIAKAFRVNNVIQQDVFDLIAGYLESKGVEFTKAAQRMAYAPEGAEMIKTEQSIIPGYRIGNVYVMAGIPSVMQRMLDGIIEDLQTGKKIINAKIHSNASEGAIAAALDSIQNEHANIDIGSYPQDRGTASEDFKVAFVVKGTDSDEITQVCDKIILACKTNNFKAHVID